jgi:hypothetical protein
MSSRSRMALCLVTIALASCGEGSSRPANAQADPAKNGYNACRLLKSEELDALTEKKVLLASVEEASPERSVCQWEDSSGLVFKLTVYWTGGKQGWQTWRTAHGQGGASLSKEEGIHPDSIIKQGIVPGLGDAAYFSELLPSLLLKDDTLAEMEMSLVPHPEKKFRQLATTLLSRL